MKAYKLCCEFGGPNLWLSGRVLPLDAVSQGTRQLSVHNKDLKMTHPLLGFNIFRRVWKLNNSVTGWLAPNCTMHSAYTTQLCTQTARETKMGVVQFIEMVRDGG